MNVSDSSTVAGAATEHPAIARKQIRGSSLLFAGRMMSQVITLVVHVIVVRYLSTAAFGAFVYAMAVTQTIGLFSTFGLDRAISRFVPIYHEKEEFGKMFGTMLLVVLTIFGIGIAIPISVVLLRDTIATNWLHEPEVMSLLLIAIFLVPLDALDALIINMFAVFAKPPRIFFRRHLLAPMMRLSIAVLMVLFHSDARFLMYGTLASMALAVGICGVVLYRMIEKQGLWQHFQRSTLSIPWREILAFTIPLLSTDILFLFMNGFDVIMLEYFGNITDVAAYRSVGPVARLNSVVFTTFTILYTPQASRLFARNDSKGINDLYWKTATWIAVLTFPVFIASFSLAQPLTLLLFGEEYADSGKLLAILAVGYYVNAALGFNGTTLTIYRRVWYIAFITILAAGMNLGLNYYLIPRYGAMGAAVGTSTTLVIHNIMKQVGLLMGTGVNVVDRRYLRVYFIIAASAVLLLAAQYFGNLHFIVSVALAIVVFLIVVRANRDLLDVTETFPELMRVPLITFLLGKSRP